MTDESAPLRRDAIVPAGLPPDEAALLPRRLAWGAVVPAVVFALLLATEPLRPPVASLGVAGLTATVLGLLLSLGVSYAAPRLRLGTQAFLDLAVSFEVLVGLAFWIGELAFPMANTPHVPGIPTVAAWILFFPQLVPLPTRHAVLGTVLLVAGGPIVLAFYVAAGQTPPPLDGVFVWTLPMIVVGIGSVFTHITVRRGIQNLRAARERDQYELVDRLATGGMGELYVARHHRLARLAALKRIRTDLGSWRDLDTLAELQERFALEARTIARLRSPHTVELYDAGVTEDGALYYAMELLDGIDLQDLVERFGPLPPARVVHLLLQACESLAEAHALGIVHRDIKPSNLMACRVARRHDVLKVVDFGLVALPRTGDGRLTQAGAYLGTPAYAAPELMHDAAEPRSDLYALGCVGWWLLTGAPVFEDADPAALLMAHRERPIPRLAEATPLPIPDALADAIAACLGKAPDDRPASADALADRLRAVDVAAWSEADARAWWARHADDVQTPVTRSGPRLDSAPATVPLDL